MGQSKDKKPPESKAPVMCPNGHGVMTPSNFRSGQVGNPGRRMMTCKKCGANQPE